MREPLRVSSSKARVSQGALFAADRRLETMGAKRSLTGDFFEELAKCSLDLDRVKIDSRADICPDLRVGSSRTFVESKAIGQSGQAILYSNRVAKDRRFIREGSRLVYLFWRHRFPVATATTLDELRAGLAGAVERLCAVDARTLWSIIRERPRRRINSRYMKSGVRNGYGSDGYGIGWSFPYSLVASRCDRTYFPLSGRPYGFDVVDVPFCSTSEAFAEINRAS